MFTIGFLQEVLKLQKDVKTAELILFDFFQLDRLPFFLFYFLLVIKLIF